MNVLICLLLADLTALGACLGVCAVTMWRSWRWYNVPPDPDDNPTIDPFIPPEYLDWYIEHMRHTHHAYSCTNFP